MPSSLYMLEYLERVGVDITRFVDEKAIKNEYLRQIYRLDARERMLDRKGKVIGRSSNPRHLH